VPTKILFLVPYPLKHAPSQRFRVELFEPFLKESGFQYKIAPFIDEKTWDILYKGGSAFQKTIGILKGYLKRWKIVLFEAPAYDYIFIHRETAPLGPPIFEWLLAKVFRRKIIYDFDDAIWIPNTSKENNLVAWFKAFWKVKLICKWSYKVVGGNVYLCNYAKQFNKNVVLIPTCVDVVNGHNQYKTPKEDNLVIGWTGSHSTLVYLDEIIPEIERLNKEFDFTFSVIANKNPELPLANFEFIPWKEETEVADLLNFDIGIMPLTPDKWSEGKCGFKLIQYLALGIPAVASPVGVNNEIIKHNKNGFLVNTQDEWYEALKILLSNFQMRKQMSEAGRDSIVNRYSVQTYKTAFLNLFV
jgi:glycosyltransferase involved in cell wall biosynthesis